MSPNHKLTGVIKGRTFSGSSNSGDLMTIVFTDGSKMTVKTAGTSNSASTGGTVKGVRQGGTTLELEFEDGGKLATTTAEETASVMVRDSEGKMEYAD
jgi:hypothetical protein